MNLRPRPFPLWRHAPAGVIAALLLVSGCKKYDLTHSADQIAAGKRFVAQRHCPECHQSSRAADGVLSGQTTPQPDSNVYGANLTPDVATGLGGWADIEIVRALRQGVDREQMPLCPIMPRFDGSNATEPAMTDLEADLIIAYLRSLPAVSRAIPESTCRGIKPPGVLDLSVAGAAIDLSASAPADLAGAADLESAHD